MKLQNNKVKNWMIKNKEFLWKIIGIVFLTIVISTFIVSVYGKYDLNSNSRYTVGTTISIFGDAKGNRSVHYEYFINGEKFETRTAIPKYYNLIVPNGRYYVIFSKKRPHNSEMLIDRRVPDTVKNAPKDGWDSCPN